MLLNKIPVLDKGFVAVVSSSNTYASLKNLSEEFFDGESADSLKELGTLTLVIKCPLFVQLNLSKYNLKVINTYQLSSELEAYIPNAAEVSASDLKTSEDIADDLSRTTAALLINPRAYEADGADRFISQIITPLNVYTTLIVHGAYTDWCAFSQAQANIPMPIKMYHEAVKQIIDSEWK